MQRIKKTAFPLILALALFFSGCGEAAQTDTGQSETSAPAAQDTASAESEDPAEAELFVPSSLTTRQAEAPSGEEGTQEPADPAAASSSASLADIPAYSGTPYVAVNGNVPFFTDADKTTEAFETYSELDALGRCGVAFANICTEIMPTEERGAIGSVRPSGWQTVKYSGVVDGNYLYNRCHLIGFQLAGENANEKNLITGTRYLNIEGMLPFENMVADYVKETGSHVLYRVTPMFDGENLVASGVLMEAMSVEDGGKDLLFNVYCYNVQPGITIDYATGDSSLDGDAAAETAASAQQEEENPPQAETSQQAEASQQEENPPQEAEASPSSGTTYILNTNTKKFHYPTCYSVNRMSEQNKQEYTGTRDEVIGMGYDPCGNCNP